jgi:S-adenosylmethionine-dependent methyltransferase
MAQHGAQVTMLDHSQAMLARATARAHADGISCTAIRADASQLLDLDLDPFTLIVCHNVLAYVTDGASLVAAMADLLQPGGHLSLVVSNRIAEPFGYVIERRDLPEAIRWAVDPPRIRQGHTFQRPMRLHDQEELSEWVHSADLRVETIAGLNVLAPYLSDDFKESHYSELFQLEEALGRQPHYARIAMYLHLIARRHET